MQSLDARLGIICTQSYLISELTRSIGDGIEVDIYVSDQMQEGRGDASLIAYPRGKCNRCEVKSQTCTRDKCHG